tara:strand:+ start:1968 stop:2354 length:387 start_codon:yes stop_codon:yes gene_type:complete
VWALSLYLEKAIIKAKIIKIKTKNRLGSIKKLLDTKTANIFPAANMCMLIFQKNEITSAQIVIIKMAKKINLTKGKIFKQELFIIPPTSMYIVFVINGIIRSLLSCISNDPISPNLTKTTPVRIGKIV